MIGGTQSYSFFYYTSQSYKVITKRQYEISNTKAFRTNYLDLAHACNLDSITSNWEGPISNKNV
jgi:hypothetical protein